MAVETVSDRTYPRRKVVLREKLFAYLDKYAKVMLVHIEFVRSKQIQDIRMALRPLDTEVLMGKNSVIKTAMAEYIEKSGRDDLADLAAKMVGNVGMVFTNAASLSSIKDKIIEFVVPSVAKPGLLAPSDVTVPAGPTGLEVAETSYFQAMDIPTRIARNAIEIVTPVQVVFKGEKVSPSAASLLKKLNILPFKFGAQPVWAFEDGLVYDAALLDLTDDDYVTMFNNACGVVASLGLGAGLPNFLTIPHSVLNCFKVVLGIALATDVPCEYAKEIKAILDDPEALQKLQAAAAAAAPAADAGAAAAEEEEEEESSSEGGGFDLFG